MKIVYISLGIILQFHLKLQHVYQYLQINLAFRQVNFNLNTHYGTNLTVLIREVP